MAGMKLVTASWRISTVLLPGKSFVITPRTAKVCTLVFAGDFGVVAGAAAPASLEQPQQQKARVTSVTKVTWVTLWKSRPSLFNRCNSFNLFFNLAHITEVQSAGDGRFGKVSYAGGVGRAA